MSIFNKYISSQKGIFYSHVSKIIKSSKCDVLSEKSAVSWEIVFKDGSTLETFEVVETNNDIIEKKKYGYEYKRPSGFFLFYELDEEKSSVVEKLWKPKYHLHVGVKKEKSSLIKGIPELLDHNGPHYKAPPITIDEMVGMIIVNFFSDDNDLVEKLKIEQF
jgi:hypothetical protein